MNTSQAVRLEHAFLYVRDLARTLPFYEALFPNWTLRWEGEGERGRRWVHFGATGEPQGSYLSLYELGDGVDADVPDSPNARVSIAHIGFAAPDVDAVVTRAAQAGIAPTDVIRSDGFHRVYFADPDGHQLEFVEPLVA